MTTDFGTRLRRTRLRAGMTQEQLAERAGVGVRVVRAMEAGSGAVAPRVGTVELLADALGLRGAERVELLTSWADGSRARDGDPSAGSRMAEVAGQLAEVLRWRLRSEEESEPPLLPVSWRPAWTALVDSGADTGAVRSGGAVRSISPQRRPDQLAELYARIPSGRLVVLGKPGSGKTTLVRQLALGLLDARAPADPVPVPVSAGSWNPVTTPLHDWLADLLERDHPSLSRTGPGREHLAVELVATGHVLPVLDGFDEIADDLRRAALTALSRVTLPLVLTSRSAEYAEAVRATGALIAATVVELADLTADDVADHLRRTTRDRPGGTRWEPVLAEVDAHPDGPLATVLTTPLMVGLADEVYGGAAGRDPAELLDETRFGSPEAIADHLLDDFVPTVYDRAVGRSSRWRADDAERWLGHLARGMARTGDLAWWELGGPRSAAAAIGVLVALVFGGAGVVVGWLGASPVDGMLTALAIGLVFALAHAGTTGAPSRLRLRPPRLTWSRARWALGPRLLIGLALGVLPWLSGGLGRDAVTGLVAGLSGGLLAVLTGVFEAPFDRGAAGSPAGSLAAGRRATLVQSLVVGLALGVAVGFAHGPWQGLVLGLAGAVGFALATRGRWLVVARGWLPLTRRLPWAVITFLEDACWRGVLRRVGAVYQFRHDRLRDRLARSAPVRAAARGRFNSIPRVPLPIGATGSAIAIALSLVAARPLLARWGLAVTGAEVFVLVVVLLTAGQLLVQQAVLRLTPAAVDPDDLEPVARRARLAARERELRWVVEHRAPLAAEPPRWDRPGEEDRDVANFRTSLVAELSPLDRPRERDRDAAEHRAPFTAGPPRSDHTRERDRGVAHLRARGPLVGLSAVEAAVEVARTCGVVVDALWPRLAPVVPAAIRRRIAWLDLGVAFFRVVLASAVAATAVLVAAGSLAFATVPVLALVLSTAAARRLVTDAYTARADAADAYRPALLRALHLPPPITHDGLIAMGDRLTRPRSPEDRPTVEWVDERGGGAGRGVGADELREVTERLGDLVSARVREDVERLHDRLAGSTDRKDPAAPTGREVEVLAARVADRTSAVLDDRFARGFEELRARLGDELAKLVEVAMVGPELVDFAGYLVVELAGGAGVARTGTGVVTARPGTSIALVVSVVADELARDAAPDRLTAPEAFLALETVQVDGGRTEPEVTFDLIADSATVNAHPHRAPLRVPHPRGERRQLIALDLPDTAERHELWLQLYQEGRLVQALAVTVDTRTPAG